MTQMPSPTQVATAVHQLQMCGICQWQALVSGHSWRLLLLDARPGNMSYTIRQGLRCLQSANNPLQLVITQAAANEHLKAMALGKR